MPTTTPVQMRLPDATKAKIEALAAKWGGLTPATRTAVVVEAIDRAHAAELPAKPKRRAKP
jgi:hypothetical protein